MDKAWILFLTYSFGTQALFIYALHKMVNKIMSRDYYEYKKSDIVGKPKEEKKKALVEEEMPEVSHLNGII